MDEVHKPEKYGMFRGGEPALKDRRLGVLYENIATVVVELQLDVPNIFNRPRNRVTPSVIEQSVEDVALFSNGAKQVVVTHAYVSYIYELVHDMASKDNLLPVRHLTYRKVEQNI